MNITMRNVAPIKMNNLACIRGGAKDLRKIFINLVILQLLIASTVVECSLTAVMHSSPSAALLPDRATGPLNGMHRNTVSAVRVSTANVAEQMTDLAPSLKIHHNNFVKPSAAPSETVQAIEANPIGVGETTLLQRLGGMVKNVIAPTKYYVDLVNRYHKWFYNYKTLQRSSKHQLRDSTDVLKDEYAKVDEIMMEEEAAKYAAEQEEARGQAGEGDQPTKSMDPKRAENMDFVFRALKLVIERLEKQLEELEQREGISIDENAVSAAEAEPEMNDERVQRAMERVKRTVMKSAKNLIQGEMAIIARTAVLNGFAQFMEAKPDTGDALDHLRPIVFMIGSASTPLAVSYLMSVEFRAALAIVEQANPLSLLGINLKKKT